MNTKVGKPVLWLGLLALACQVSVPLRAQEAGAALSGKITGPTGAVVANAKVSVKNLATGKSVEAQTNVAGVYRVAHLAAGDYRISVTAEGFQSKTATITLSQGVARKMDLELRAALSLQDLGFPSTETQGSSRKQALLDKRSHMLQIHQKLGLITAVPMVATLISSVGAGGRHSSATGRNLHIALGSVTAGLYFTTAYYAIFAPKVAGVQPRGAIRFHRALAWIHGPGMILTPILGAMADAQRSRGERVHGIASAHAAVAIVTASAYLLALVAISKPHLFSRSAHDALALFHFHHSAAAGAVADAGR